MADADQLEASVHKLFNRLRGRLAGEIEGWAITPIQRERTLITNMKSMTYDFEAELVDLICD